MRIWKNIERKKVMESSELNRQAMERFREEHPNGWSGSQDSFIWEINHHKTIISLKELKRNPLGAIKDMISTFFKKSKIFP